MSRYSREVNGQPERGRKRLRKKWALGQAGDPFTYVVNRSAPRTGGMFARVFVDAIVADLEITAEAMFAEPQWWRSGRELPTMADGKRLFDDRNRYDE